MRTLAVVNPAAGRMKAGEIFEKLRRHFDPTSWGLDIYQTSAGKSTGEFVSAAVDSGLDQVFAVGGDGTISAVVDGLVHSSTPLGIIPTGTSNVIAQELGIPSNIDKACEVLSGNPTEITIDAIQVGDRYFVLAVGTGIDAQVMETVSRKRKRQFGPAAYVWSTLKVIVGMQPRRFTIIADGRSLQTRAAVIMLSNMGTLTRPLRWGPGIKPDDGLIDINIIRGKHLLDYMLAAYDVLPGGPRKTAHIRRLQASESITVNADQAVRVQGDGDLIGYTPLEARVIPGAVKVLVPGSE